MPGTVVPIPIVIRVGPRMGGGCVPRRVESTVPLNERSELMIGTVNRTTELTSVINRHNHYSNRVRARLGGDNRQRILALLTGIYPKLSRGESKYP